MKRTSNRVMRRAQLALLLAGLLVAPSALSAQELGAQQVEQFETTPAFATDVLNIASSSVLPHLGVAAGALFHYVSQPLRVVPVGKAPGDPVSVISSQTKADVMAAIGLFDWFDLGVGVPVIMVQTGDSSTQVGANGVSGAAIGDLRIIPRIKVLPREWAGGFGIAVEAPVYIPSGDKATFNGEGFRAEPRLIVDYEHEVGFGIALNGGYLIRKKETLHDVVNDDVIRWGAGVHIPLGAEGLQLLGSVFGSVQTADSLRAGDLNQATNDLRSSPMEALGAIRYAMGSGFVAQLGAGRGLNGAVGAPEFRVLASLGFQPTLFDTDGDGYVDDEDGCPNAPEDFDEFEDADGCPDLDNDQDKIVDTEDECPLEPEDYDEFEDVNGCPDPDNDQDTIADVNDTCPMEPEDMDEFEDENGCPDPDNDRDLIADLVDSCPMEPEDIDNFEDENGCPDPDNDKDGIVDVVDKCPLEPEVINGFEDEDGCPDKGQPKVVVTMTKIEIMDMVYFETNKADIKKVSFDILNQVASVMKANPQITKLRVEGHTDDVGKDSKNLKLSQERAKSVVKYLVDRGIEEERLLDVGFGETIPLKEGTSKAARAANRRVEFIILEINGVEQKTDY